MSNHNVDFCEEKMKFNSAVMDLITLIFAGKWICIEISF